MAKNPSTKTITTPKGTLAYAWIDRKSIKYGKYEATLRLEDDQVADLRKIADEFVADNVPAKRVSAVEFNPFKPMKDKTSGKETAVIKARSGYAPDVFNAKGVQLAYPPKVGPGSVVKIGISFELQDRDDKLKLLCRLKSCQIIKLVEFTGGANFEDESEDEDAYTGEGGTAPAETAKTEKDAGAGATNDPTKF